VRVWKTPFAKRAKSLGGKQLPPVLRMMPGRVAFIGLHDFGECCNPYHAFIAHIPDEPENAARFQDAMDFHECFAPREPMKGLRADDSIDGGVSKRDMFRRPLLRRDAGIAFDELRQHCRDRLDGNNCRIRGVKAWDELSSSSAEVEHGLAFAQSKVAAQPIFHLRG